MFDINDIIHLSMIADRYLVEYEALLISSKMQASNVSGNFRSLNFTDSDISGIDYNSDSWVNDSVTESSETSGELTNAVGDAPEYIVTAGRKPLSLIIRRCSTPSSANSSPSRKVRTEMLSRGLEKCIDKGTSEAPRSVVVHLSGVPEEKDKEEAYQQSEASDSARTETTSVLREDADTVVELIDTPYERQNNVPVENAVDDLSLSHDISYVLEIECVTEHDECCVTSDQIKSNEVLDSFRDSDIHIKEENSLEEISQFKSVADTVEVVSLQRESSSPLVQTCNEEINSELLGMPHSVASDREFIDANERCVEENHASKSILYEVENDEIVENNTTVSTGELSLVCEAVSEVPDTNISSGYDSVHSKLDELVNLEKDDKSNDLMNENKVFTSNNEEGDLNLKIKVSRSGESSQKNILDDVELIIKADVASTPKKIENGEAAIKVHPLVEKEENNENCAPLKSFVRSPHCSQVAEVLSFPVPLSGESFFPRDSSVSRSSGCVVENFAELPLEGSSAVLDTIKSECSGSLPFDNDNLIDISSVVYGSDMLGNSSCADYSPLLFSSDDESPSFKDEVKKRIEAALAPSPGYTAVISHEKTRLSRLQEMLIGAPPPPSITMPHHSVADMMRLLKENEHLMVPMIRGVSTDVFLTHREAMSATWPRAKYCQYHGIHYNHGVVSESYESQCQKLQERCVGNETASSCTLWSYSSGNTSSKERRPVRRQPSGASPGRRLSHLAQRQRTFSSSNLLTDRRLHNILPHCAPERRTIMVNVKKKSTRKPRSSQKKRSSEKPERVGSVPAAKLNSSKRALFQSPEEKQKKSSSLSKFRVSENHCSDMRSRRALFVDDSSQTPSRKRKCEEAEVSARKTPRRSLFRDSESSTSEEIQKQIVGRAHSLRGGENVIPEVHGRAGSSSEISSYHKKKLLWAVAEALKQGGIGTAHPSFRDCAAALATRCRGHIQKLLADRQGSTSDRMFALASEYVGDIITSTVKKGGKGT